MTLHFYFARRFTVIFAGMFAVFFLFVMLLDLIEQLRRFDEEVGFSQVLRITLLNTPQGLYQMLPLVMILSSIALCLALARSSELVVSRASGRSGLSALFGPLAVAALVGAIAVAAFNPIVAATSQRYHDLRELYDSGGTSTLSIGREGLWLRQGDLRGQTVIHAERSNPTATVLHDVTFIAYAAEGGPVRRIAAEEAALGTGEWVLTQAKVWPLVTGLNPETNSFVHEELHIPSTLTQERIRDSFGKPSAVSIWNLPAFIRQLETAGFSARRHSVWLQMELARPVFLVAMVLLGAAFTMRHARFGRTGLAVLTALMLGFGLYYVRNFAQILGENGQIPASLAAWAPPVAAALIGLGLILQMEDG
ncbi:LPS export ABC transporter permease LptG [Phaeobacter sp. J2-8]|uniref:LPS export ABC transporter permease LptG n=1 Tax=Phaeobacter sp. J2-8 TaxID=2931394 RepID=UPI001FD3651C|nr:LPS export ABC transporter permease LptG [Phaeobacter sp. J2-8]MCJ7873700.1 LPS export ABC transporter permease LptG [Phaeobacter sp. J2-8]